MSDLTDGTTGSNIRYTEQHIANMSYDQRMALAARLLMGYDDTPGAEGTRRVAVNQNGQLEVDSLTDEAIKYIQVGKTLYVANALPGTDESDPLWKVFQLDITAGRIKYADGDKKYDNVATDLTLLNYL